MRLKICAVQLRVCTAELICGTDITFNDGLVIVHAENSHGKSTVMQSIIYGLGLEGMLSASHDVPLPHVMTDSIDLPDGSKENVLTSYVTIEIENAKREVVTVTRSVKGAGSNHLIKVATGPLLTDPKCKAEYSDYYVRERMAATSERGFHRWFVDFLGWTLPQVARVDGTTCPLYVECIFPLMLIEQKRGWSAIQARMPYHFRIREVAKRSFEFLLRLEVNDLALLRQQLREESHVIRSEWAVVVERIANILKAINGVPQELDHTPRLIGSEETIPVLIARGGKWLPFSEALKLNQADLQRLEQQEIPRVEKISDEAESALRQARDELAQVDVATNDLFRAVQQDDLQISNLDDRLISLEEDYRRNADLIKLKKLGSTSHISAAGGHCPTCHQPVTDSLIPLNQQTPMTAEQNIDFIKAQLETFTLIKRTSATALNAKRRRLDSLRIRATELRSTIRALQKTLVSDGREPSVAAIEARLLLRSNVAAFRQAADDMEKELPRLRELGKRWDIVMTKIRSLPKGDLSTDDKAKLNRLTEIFIAHAKQFELSSVDPRTLKISEENYRPEHEGFDLEFDLSASDMIRTIWAYLHSLLEIAKETKTNHLNLLILDEPRQQETARTSFRQLFVRAAANAGANQQVIVATSEEQANLQPLLATLPHQLISFRERIVKPLGLRAEVDQGPAEPYEIDEEAKEIEMPWESEAHSAVKRAIDSFEWNAAERTIRYRGFNGQVHTATSYDDLYSGLCAVALEGWFSLVPFDEGEPVFPSDKDSIVERHLAPRAADLHAFFDQPPAS
ncbi:hypothetical protein OpiT1DRAFT_03284 [Opitutaceae bacterium TAV1]|nr:hypothetical protein OpiT1DRAFT_03284 [Opitutaceae bacterium TAV1]